MKVLFAINLLVFVWGCGPDTNYKNERTGDNRPIPQHVTKSTIKGVDLAADGLGFSGAGLALNLMYTPKARTGFTPIDPCLENLPGDMIIGDVTCVNRPETRTALRVHHVYQVCVMSVDTAKTLSLETVDVRAKPEAALQMNCDMVDLNFYKFDPELTLFEIE